LEKGFLIEDSRDSKTKRKIVAPKSKIPHPLRKDSKLHMLLLFVEQNNAL
jgi:hypothetical protein